MVDCPDIDNLDLPEGEPTGMSRARQGIGLRNPGSFRSQVRDVNGASVPFTPNEPALIFKPESNGEANSVVYFIGRRDLAEIYIGSARGPNPSRRINQHQNDAKNHGGPGWELLAFVAGDKPAETRCHTYFGEIGLGVNPSTFRASSEIIDYIRWLRDFYATETDEAKNVGQCSISEWIPNSDRRKSVEGQLPFGDWLGILGKRTVTADDFHTPPPIINAARNAMGRIDLDPASSYFANREIGAKFIFMETDRGQDQKWYGNVWLNPPFAVYPEFAAAAVRERENYKALCLLASERSITTKYFEGVRRAADALCIINGRLNFCGIVDPNTGSATFGFLIFYLGPDVGRFAEAFSGLGQTFRRAER